MSRKDRTIEAALAYADLGWPVLPLYSIDEKTGKCTCQGRVKDCKAGKHPHSKYAPHGSKDATTDVSVIKSWFSNGDETINIGICAGQESSLVILDVDPQHGGNDSLKQFGKMPQTPTVMTGSGGSHYYFKHPGGDVRNSAGTVGEGLDVRGHNGYVVCPPSLHASGQEYRWIIDARAPLAKCPAWILNGHTKKKSPSVKVTESTEVVKEGQRNNAMTVLAGKLRRAGLRSKAIFAALLYENNIRCNPPLPEPELKTISESMMSYEPDSVPSTYELLRTCHSESG